jgi:poly-beta-hydroxyalkanoate depolymerase
VLATPFCTLRRLAKDVPDPGPSVLVVARPGAHALAVSQAAVPTLAAAAFMAEDANPARPRSLALIAGPVDVRVNPIRATD